MADFVEPDEDLGSIVPTDDEDFSPRPELEEIEARLADPTLFGDDIQQDEAVLDTQPQVYSLGRSWLFDFSQSRFVRDDKRARAPVRVSGLPQLLNWVEKALYTPRGALPIHSDDYGLEDPGVIGSPFTSATAATLKRRVEETVTFHPKIIGIDDFTAALAPDDESALEVSFQLRLDNDEVVPFSTRLQ